MPRISIIIPVHNTPAEYLRECVASVHAQSLHASEVIIVDDHSEPECAALCRSLPGKYILNEGRGVSEARNTGLRHSSGDYIIFVDSDDRLMPDSVKILYDLLTENEADIAVGQMTQDSAVPASASLHVEICNSLQAIESQLYQKPLHHPSAWAKIYRRKVLEACQPLFVKDRRYEDLEACPRIYHQAARIAVSDAVVYYYRPNGESFINQWSDAREDALWAVEEIKNFVAQHYPALEKAAASRAFSAYYNILGLAERHNKKELASRCWNVVTREKYRILFDSKVRFKNRIGAFVALTGRALTRQFLLLVY